jgi:predicted nucleotidyltransferase
MDARPLLETIARVLHENGLEAVLIGNAAAALHGAPVTTVDFDFLFRQTPRNIAKLKAVAKSLDAVILRPYYPSSGLFRIARDEDGLQIDFMTTIDGIKSFESLRAQSQAADFDGCALLIASLDAVISSKRAAGRPRDKAVLDILEKVLREQKESRPPASEGSERPPAKTRRIKKRK